MPAGLGRRPQGFAPSAQQFADALIEQYVRELKTIAAKPYASAVLPEAGALVSLAA